MRQSSQLQATPIIGRTKSGDVHEKQEISPEDGCDRRLERRRILRRDGKLCVFFGMPLNVMRL